MILNVVSLFLQILIQEDYLSKLIQIYREFNPKLEQTPGIRLFFGGEEESQESLQSLFSALTLALWVSYLLLLFYLTHLASLF